ncbi:SCO5717 family growth-regulating ATPase [Streptomyces sp. GTA36]
MNSDRDGIRGGWATPGDDQSDAESAVETTGEFTIDYAPPAWYTQNASEEFGGGLADFVGFVGFGRGGRGVGRGEGLGRVRCDRRGQPGERGGRGGGCGGARDALGFAGFRAFLRARGAFYSARCCAASFCSCSPLYS